MNFGASPSDHVVIGVNPKAGATAAGAAARRLQEALQGLGLEPHLESDLATICELAHKLEKAGRLRAVVAVGGDGTVGLFANHLSAEVPLTILPQGTENLLAKYLEIPQDPDQVAEMIKDNHHVRLDAGMANDRVFLVMASCGFDAQVVHQLHGQRDGHIRHWSYVKPILDSIRKYQYPTIHVSCDGRPPVKAKWAFVFNVPRYAMGLAIAEDADARDGRLDLCAFRGGNLLNGVLYLFGILARQHRRWRDTVLAHGERFTLTAKDPVPYQLDGDPGGFLPLEIRVLPGRLKLIVSRRWTRQGKLQGAAATAG